MTDVVTEIRQGGNLVTLINVFTVKPGKQDEFMNAQIAEYKRLEGQIKGTLTINLHRSLDGTKCVNYAQFSSETDYRAWVKSDLFKEHFEKIKDLVEQAEPALYEVVYIQHS